MNSLLRIVLTLLVFVTVTVDATQITNIHQIDFKNFAYPWDESTEDVPLTWRWTTLSSPPLRLQAVNGIHHFYEKGQSQTERARAPLFSVDSVTYGDLNGDGIEEAVVALNYSTGGTANWDYLYVYKLVHGHARLLGRMETGSRGYGGLVKVSIQNGLLVVEFTDADRHVGDCCSEGYVRVRYRWREGGFIEEGPRERGDLDLHEH